MNRPDRFQSRPYVVCTTHDEMHVYVPEERKAEDDALLREYLAEYLAEVMRSFVPPSSVNPDLMKVWYGDDTLKDAR